MCKKIIIIGWHFNTKNCKPQYNNETGKWEKIEDSKALIYKLNSKEYVELNSDYRIYLMSHPKSPFENDEKEKVNCKINKIIKGNKKSKILLLFHQIPWELDDFKSIDKMVFHIFSASRLYWRQDNKQGILDNSENVKCLFYSGEIDSIEKLNWNFVWEEYYSGLSKKKNELIKLWLPLAIDIQGLSEVMKNNKKKAPKYLKDIKNNSNNFLDLQKKHNEIIIKSEKISGNFRISDSENNEIYNLLKLLNKKNDDNFGNMGKYLDKEKECFLPKFLKNIVSKFDEVIKNQNSE